MEKIYLEEQQTINKRTAGMNAPIDEDMEVSSSKKNIRTIVGVVFLILVGMGIGTGYILSNTGSKGAMTSNSLISTSGAKTYGSTDTKLFTDTAVGTLEKDGIDGEGTHKLIRDGGPTQTACLVSSVLDLDEFVGKKIKVWSKTNTAKKCPWFMDVGRIELQ